MYLPYGKQTVTEADIESVVSVLRSDWLTQGPVVPSFEAALAKRVGCSHAVAANSATSALHLACLALEVGPGDIVWTSPISFVASSNCALYCGAEIDFVDINIKTYNMDIESLENKLEFAERTGSLPKCVIAVHLSGKSCDMQAIKRLSEKYGFRIIEDASHAVGATYGATQVGSCAFSDVTVFSFHPVKIITTGEGGVALTNNPDLAAKMALFRSHGITRDEALMTNRSDGMWYYQQLELGYNYRMSDVAAALGLSQMSRLSDFVSQRNIIADRYDDLLAKFAVTLPTREENSVSSFHLYIMRVDTALFEISHKALFEKFRENGIGVNLHYIPIYRHPYYQKQGFDASAFPASEAYYKTAISLPIFPALTEEEQNSVVQIIESPKGFQNIF